MSETKKLAAIILAGGIGTRMGDTKKHKCKYEINGVPSILLLIDSLRKVGVSTNVLVVGALSEQVLGLVGKEYNDIIYTYQPKQKGTGNAAKHGLYPLIKAGFEGDVMIIAGDAYVEPQVLKKLLQLKENNDMALLVKNKSDVPTAGRIIRDKEGVVLASIEYWDIQKVIVGKKLREKLIILPEYMELKKIKEILIEKLIEIKEIMENYLHSKKKIKQIFPTLSKYIFDIDSIKVCKNPEEILEEINHIIINLPISIVFNGINYDPEVLENNSTEVNISVYLFESQKLYSLIDEIDSNNAQNEEYLTDILEIFQKNGAKIKPVKVDYTNQVMSFNTPEELKQINDYVRNKRE